MSISKQFLADALKSGSRADAWSQLLQALFAGIEFRYVR